MRVKEAVQDAAARQPSRIRPIGLGRPVRAALEDYFEKLGTRQPAGGLYELAIAEVERPLYELVMERYDHNVTQAAAVLGINRATLSKRLKKYGLAD